MSKYFLMLDPEVACKIGLNEALILSQLAYWQRKYGGRWISNSYEMWHKQFAFWSVRTIQRAFSSLEQRGFIESKRTSYCKVYRLCIDKVNEFLNNQDEANCQINTTDCQQDTTDCAGPTHEKFY